MTSAEHVQKPNILLPLVRVVLISALLTLLCFAIGLFVGIVGVGVANLVRGGGLSLSIAYRYIAFPVAVVALGVSLIGMSVTELREFRQRRSEYRDWQRAA